MREIRQKTLSAGPEGIHHPGHTRTLPRDEAAMLVKGGFAEYTTEEPSEKATIKAPETATSEENEAPEVESAKKSKKKRNGRA
jgi:hypothetical protein